MPNYTENAGQLMLDPAVSYWLKAAVRSLHHHDPVDALRDAEALTALQAQRLAELQPPILTAEVIG